MAKRKRVSNNPAGRTSEGLSEEAVVVRMTSEQLEATDAAAAAEGVSRTEWIREAMRARLPAKPPTAGR